MIDELTKNFFDTFGIEPEYKTCIFKYCPYKKEYDCENCDDRIWHYPEITDHILLELLCILADVYDSDSYGYPLLSKDIKELKEDVLDGLMGAIDVENDYPEGYANKVRTIFEEV